MAVPPKERKPHVGEHVPGRQIKLGGNPENFDKETIAWQFYRLDYPHIDWGWQKLKAGQWRDILNHLRSFEGLTWAKLKEQAGGRKRGTNHHPVQIEDFNKSARDRLAALRLDEFVSLFSLRISSTLRLYGVRDGRVLQIVWHDPHHGSGKGAYPTANR